MREQELFIGWNGCSWNIEYDTVQMYDCTLMIAIYGQEKVVNLELKLEILGRNFLKVTDTRRILERLVFSYESNQKVIDIIAQLIVRLCYISQLYLKTSKQEELSRIMYIFNIIWFLDRNITDRKAVLVMMLFNNPSNNFNSVDEVNFVRILCSSINAVSIK